jgi:hypothetical protein
MLSLIAIACPAAASAGAVRGTVTDEISGIPVQGIRVGAGPVGYGLRDYTYTAADGTYEIGGLEEGQVNVCFLPEPGVNLLRQCWKSSPTAYGQAIAVPATGTIDDVDATLPPGTAVAGRVTNWEGQPLAGVCVSAWTSSGGGMRRAADATTDERGGYTVVGLEPGVPHRVVFAPVDGWLGHCTGGVDYPGYVEQWFDRQATMAAATELTPALSETTGGVDGILGASATPPPGANAPGARCVVPRLRNKTFAAARSALTKAGCSTPMPTRRSSRDFRRGRVIKSRPAARTRVRRGTRVTLVVSRSS